MSVHSDSTHMITIAFWIEILWSPLFHLIPRNFHFHPLLISSHIQHTVCAAEKFIHSVNLKMYYLIYSEAHMVFGLPCMVYTSPILSSISYSICYEWIEEPILFFVGLIVIRFFFPLNSAVLLSRCSLLWNASHEQVKITWQEVRGLSFAQMSKKRREYVIDKK